MKILKDRQLRSFAAKSAIFRYLAFFREEMILLLHEIMSIKKSARFLSVLLALLFPLFSAASVPPPPVNQYIGFPDMVMNNLTWEACLGCHGDPENAPLPVKRGYLPDRHHLRVDTPIEEYTASPFPEESPDGTHKCLTCHQIDWVKDPSRPAGGYFAFAQEPGSAEFRNCLNCHRQWSNVASVHHFTQKAQEARCHLCHGNVINDPNDDHYIPDSGIVNVTPRPGFGSGEIGETGEKRGGCRYCHGGGVDDTSGIEVPVNPRGNANNATHHGTGIGMGGTNSAHDCLLCHNWGLEPGPLNGPYNIRGCERCHGISSLHNIQFDPVGDGIVPGEEPPFYGHVGNNLDCRGCHGPNPTFPQVPYPGEPGYDHLGDESDCLGCHRNGSYASGMRAASAALDPAFGPVVPYLSGISRNRLVAGEPATLTLTGSAFHAARDPLEMPVRVVLLGPSGASIEIAPTTVTPTLLEFVLPAQLAPGSYAVKAIKGEMGSNIKTLLLLPAVAIEEMRCSGEHVILTGSGFLGYLEAEASGTAVLVEKTGERCTVESWSDERIEAICPTLDSGGTIKVETLFGTLSRAVTCNGGDETGGRPRWWSIWSWWGSWSWARR